MVEMRNARRALIAACLLGLASAAPAQENPRPFGQGTHALRGIIRSPKPIPGYGKRFDLQPIRDFADIDASTVVIVLGDPEPLARLGDLRRFVIGGGALLVASDRRVEEPLRSELRVEVAGGFLEANDTASYGGLRECPLVNDLRGHPIFRRVDAIATNRPSRLVVHPDGPLQVFAWLPARNPRFRGADRHPFLAGGEFGLGRVLVLADHSVFINDMMLQADTDNFDFAYNCIDWLTDSGQRKKVLLVEDGEVVSNFNVSFKPPPLPKLPSQEQIVGQVNRMLVQLERENELNHLLLGMLGGHERVLRLLLLLATAGLLAYGMFRLVAARQRFDRSVPRWGPLPAAAVPLALERRDAMLAAGNCWEAARGLARHCLESAGCRRWDRQPDFRIQAGFCERLRLRGRLRRLWQLATGSPRRVTPRQLLRIQQLTEAVHRAVASGTVRLVTEVRQQA